VVECCPCPVFAGFTLAFVLQLRKKHGKTTVRVRKTSVKLRKTSVKLRKTSVTVQYTYKALTTHTLLNPLIHTLQNNIKPPQYKLKRNTCRRVPVSNVVNPQV
jgi:predicted glycosyltransferase